MPFASLIASNLVGFVIVLGFLIFAHESGHFFMAKLFKVRVLVFSFGFGRRLFGFRKGATDYRVSLIPLGGYVRMAGDTPEENQPQNPDEFLSRPKWQRFLILVAGPFMNLVIAIIFVASLSMIGLRQPVMTSVIGEVTPNMPAAKAGLQAGDRIVRIDGELIEGFDDLRMAISMHAGQTVSVEYLRGGKIQKTTLTPKSEDTDYGPVGRAGFSGFMEPVVGGVTPGSTAERSSPVAPRHDQASGPVTGSKWRTASRCTTSKTCSSCSTASKARPWLSSSGVATPTCRSRLPARSSIPTTSFGASSRRFAFRDCPSAPPWSTARSRTRRC